MLALQPVSEVVRCGWVTADPLYIDYHDREWGVPPTHEHGWFELLNLEGAQAGLSWITILKKRENYRRAFHGFDPEKITHFTQADVERLLADPGIVRHRGKIEAAIGNAHAWLRLRKEQGDPIAWLFAQAGDIPHNRHLHTLADVPTRTPASDRLSKALKKAGFRFVGSTTCYAFMQATGMVDDHVETCFRHAKPTTPPSGS